MNDAIRHSHVNDAIRHSHVNDAIRRLHAALTESECQNHGNITRSNVNEYGYSP